MGIQFILNLLERLGFDFTLQAPAPEVKAPVFAAVPGVKDNRSRRWAPLQLDLPLLLAALTLVAFGLLMMFSASADFSYQVYGDFTYSFRRQIQWVGLGLLAAAVLSLLRYQTLRKLALPAMLVTLGLLLSVLIFGEQRLNATRSLSAGSYQPSELAKLTIIIYLSAWLCSHRQKLNLGLLSSLLPVGVILGGVSALIALQPDLSAVLTVFILGILLYFLAGAPLAQFLIMAAVALATGFLVYSTDIYLTGRVRIESFLAGWDNLLLSSDHVQRSIEAFARGGWFGVGIGQSQIKLMGLPFPHTDSIFAVIGEETGVIGAAALVALYLVILYRGMRLARQAPDDFGSLLAAGLTLWLFFEAVLNMGVMIGLLPFAGNALPFISAGGSSMLFSLSAIGILLNISRQVERQASGLAPNQRGEHAVVDLRRRHRREHLSRPGSPASPEAAE